MRRSDSLTNRRAFASTIHQLRGSDVAQVFFGEAKVTAQADGLSCVSTGGRRPVAALVNM